jgi:histone H3/H4
VISDLIPRPGDSAVIRVNEFFSNLGDPAVTIAGHPTRKTV